MTDDPPTVVFLVDDDESVLRAVRRLLVALGYEVRSYDSPVAFLAEHDAEIPGCMVLDVSMPDIGGLEVQDALLRTSQTRPIVFITGAGDIPTSVRAMKAGAVDFLTKPIDRDAFLAAVERAVALDRAGRRADLEASDVRHRLAALTPREREVMGLVVGGLMNKQIAHELGMSIKTVKVHRARVMAKMNVRTIADLVRAASQPGVTEAGRAGQPAA